MIKGTKYAEILILTTSEGILTHIIANLKNVATQDFRWASLFNNMLLSIIQLLRDLIARKPLSLLKETLFSKDNYFDYDFKSKGILHESQMYHNILNDKTTKNHMLGIAKSMQVLTPQVQALYEKDEIDFKEINLMDNKSFDNSSDNIRELARLLMSLANDIQKVIAERVNIQEKSAAWREDHRNSEMRLKEMRRINRCEANDPEKILDQAGSYLCANNRYIAYETAFIARSEMIIDYLKWCNYSRKASEITKPQKAQKAHNRECEILILRYLLKRFPP